MSRDDDRREKRRRWWEDDDLFRTQFEAVKRIVEELMERLGENAPEELDEEKLKDMLGELQKNPMVWGFSAAVGPDGRVQLNPFGNVTAKGETPTVREEREPLVEVMDQDEAVMVIAELPGVAKENIQLKLDERRVAIRVDTPQRKYAKTIDLPTAVKWRRAKVHYTNGILELRLPK